MFRLGYIMFAGALMLATLLNEADSLNIHRVSMSDIGHEDYHHDCHELPEDTIDYEDSLEVRGDDLLFRSAEADEKLEENRTKRNNFHRPRPAMAQKGHLSRPIHHDDDDDSMEDLNKKLFKQQQRVPSPQNDRKRIIQSHHLMDTSDEEPSWEVKDDSLKKLFGVYWESIKDKKRNRPSMDDSMEDMEKQQHRAQHSARIGNRHAF